MYRWRELSDRGSTEVREWTNPLMSNDEAIAILSERFTGKSWTTSVGMFGLGDRVSMPNTTAQLDDDSDIIDVDGFRDAIDRVLTKRALGPQQLESVQIFADAWWARKNDPSD